MCDSHLARTGGKKAQKEKKHHGQQNLPNMGPDLHHMATFILCLKMWHLCQNSLSVLTRNPPLKNALLYILKVKCTLFKGLLFATLTVVTSDNYILVKQHVRFIINDFRGHSVRKKVALSIYKRTFSPLRMTDLAILFIYFKSWRIKPQRHGSRTTRVAKC